MDRSYYKVDIHESIIYVLPTINIDETILEGHPLIMETILKEA